MKNVLQPQAKSVRLYDELPPNQACDYIDEIIGDEANMFTFLFMSNHDMTMGARNALRNKAAALGGDTVVIQKSVFVYTTSTVFVGQVYNCH